MHELDMRDDAWHEDEVPHPVTDDLVRDAEIATPRIPRRTDVRHRVSRYQPTNRCEMQLRKRVVGVPNARTEHWAADDRPAHRTAHRWRRRVRSRTFGYRRLSDVQIPVATPGIGRVSCRHQCRVGESVPDRRLCASDRPRTAIGGHARGTPDLTTHCCPDESVCLHVLPGRIGAVRHDRVGRRVTSIGECRACRPGLLAFGVAAR